MKTADVAYLPLPNSVEFITSNELAPESLTSTSFMVPLTDDDKVVMAHNRRRGLEFPGGHIEIGETLCKAAHRETFEEVGCWVSHIKTLGFLKMKSLGEKPIGWKYPHPLSYQQFFTGRVMKIIPYIENDECLAPVILSYDEAQNLLDPQRFEIYRQALLVMKSG